MIEISDMLTLVLRCAARWCIDGGEWLIGKGPALIQWVQQLSEKKLRLTTTVDEILQVALPPAQKVNKADKKKKESEMQLAIAVRGLSMAFVRFQCAALVVLGLVHSGPKFWCHPGPPLGVLPHMGTLTNSR